MSSNRPWWFACAGVVALVTAGVIFYPSMRREAALQNRLDMRQAAGAAIQSPCQPTAARRPYVLLALGQSNAGNHGLPDAAARSITMIWNEKCITARDPLPGATGSGASIWPRLVAVMERKQDQRPVVVSVLAIDASSIDDWTRQRSPLRHQLMRQLADMKKMGMPPDAVLWQQGEADARTGTSADDYAAKLDQLATIVTDADIKAPVFLARSTVCRTPANLQIRSAIEQKIVQGGRWMSGPDTDTLSDGRFRHDGCHLSAAGLDAAADLWAASLDCPTCAARN
jgi:Carbohydrate esterase, sialic acid-specific acetylesterase